MKALEVKLKNPPLWQDFEEDADLIALVAVLENVDHADHVELIRIESLVAA